MHGRSKSGRANALPALLSAPALQLHGQCFHKHTCQTSKNRRAFYSIHAQGVKHSSKQGSTTTPATVKFVWQCLEVWKQTFRKHDVHTRIPFYNVSVSIQKSMGQSNQPQQYTVCHTLAFQLQELLPLLEAWLLNRCSISNACLCISHQNRG